MSTLEGAINVRYPVLLAKDPNKSYDPGLLFMLLSVLVSVLFILRK